MFSAFRLYIILLPSLCLGQHADNLQKLGYEFWQWRFVTQPASPDDILRVKRPDGWAPDFSAQAIARYQLQYQDFRDQLESLSKTAWTRSDSVDYLCLRSAIERVNWELNVLRNPQRNPDFYVHQTIGALYELLIINEPFSSRRVQNILCVLESFPKTIDDAKQHLTDPVAEFAQIALENLTDVTAKLLIIQNALVDDHKIKEKEELRKAIEKGAFALEDYRKWLEKKLPDMNHHFHCGNEAFTYFLKNIALIPQTPAELVQQGRSAFNRSVAFEVMERVRNTQVAEDVIFASIDDQIDKATEDERAIRNFLEQNNILSVPSWVGHYLNYPTPDHVKALSHMGVATDFTSEHRLEQNASRYIPEPSAELPYFYLTMAKDPRPIIVHEGIPGHYFQLALSWKNENPLRRRFIDSGPIEGIGLYVEEMLLQFGLFEDKPKTREIIYNFMRLRALRVEIDIRLALGTFTIEQAGNYLAETVPMDEKTAIAEAGFFAYNPGQAISYEIGKQQIFKFLSDAKIKLGDKFNLREFHDYLITNGNVPIALLRWEYLGLDDEIRPFFE